MERKKRSKGSVWEICYANKIFGTFEFEIKACGQKLVKFCAHTHTRAAKLVVEIGAFTVTSFAVSRGRMESLVGKRFAAVFCRDSFPVCLHFTHKQDHDYVLYWCGVH